MDVIIYPFWFSQVIHVSEKAPVLSHFIQVTSWSVDATGTMDNLYHMGVVFDTFIRHSHLYDGQLASTSRW